MNIIENVWHILKGRMKNRTPQPATKDQMWQILKGNGQNWGQIIVNHYTGAVQGGSMPFGVQEKDTLSINVYTKFGRNPMHQCCTTTQEMLDRPVLKMVKNHKSLLTL